MDRTTKKTIISTFSSSNPAVATQFRKVGANMETRVQGPNPVPRPIPEVVAESRHPDPPTPTSTRNGKMELQLPRTQPASWPAVPDLRRDGTERKPGKTAEARKPANLRQRASDRVWCQDVSPFGMCSQTLGNLGTDVVIVVGLMSTTSNEMTLEGGKWRWATEKSRQKTK